MCVAKMVTLVATWAASALSMAEKIVPKKNRQEKKDTQKVSWWASFGFVSNVCILCCRLMLFGPTFWVSFFFRSLVPVPLPGDHAPSS